MTEAQTKVFVGMSGGVDSSVSAALLKEAGYDVTGVFIKTWHPDFLVCTWREDRQDAMRVCAALGVPFLTCDFEDAYKREVADYMISEYALGRTPNPDVMCNQHVKFGAFFRWAREQGADMIATGHYAQIGTEDGRYLLRMGLDVTKDQSYFLWTLPQEVLARTLFPVGSMKKLDVRALAARLGLSVADKKDSQGICFLGDVDLKGFLRRFIDVTPGLVLDEKGNTIGRHEGAILYTLGERRGFTVNVKTPHDAPRYVIGKDVSRNTITVSEKPKERAHASGEEIVLGHTNWIAGAPPALGEQLSYRLRYRQPLSLCRVGKLKSSLVSIFPEAPPSFPAPGQSLVLYRGNECVGGGIIEEVLNGA
jgi:tRNA-uridine 2-sulfurtransferase